MPRKAEIAAPITKITHDRFEVILPHLHGAVLDVGCVDSRPRREAAGDRIERKPTHLFQRIAAAHPSAIGVDIDAEGIGYLRTLGFNVVCADAETMELGAKFDTIIAGELIEHVENPGRLLRNLKWHLKPNGVLILSTPNPFSERRTWKIWKYGSPAVHEDHTCWFDPITLDQMLKRTGLEPIDGYWVNKRSKRLQTWKRIFRGYFGDHFLRIARPAA